MMVRRLFVLVGVCALLAACGSADTPSSTELPLTVVATGSVGGNPTSLPPRGVLAGNRAQVLAANEELDTEWLARFPFNLDVAVVVFAGSYSTGGYSLEVEQVRRSGRELIVDAVIQSPGGGAVTQAFTEPYAILAIPRSEVEGVKNVEVRLGE